MTAIKKPSGRQHMNWKTIAVTAALLALQAVILSLLQSTTAQAELVYRCSQGKYQSAPCASTPGASTALNFKDERTEAQLAQALTQRDQIHTQGKPSKPRRVRASTSGASALSAESGMAPFHNGQWLSDAATSKARKDAGVNKARRHRGFVARVSPSTTETTSALASNER
jgi:hypothetical protein